MVGDAMRRRALLLMAVGFVLAACGGAQKVPSDARETVVSLTNIDCAECGAEIVEDLRSRPGVYKASFERHKAEIDVWASPSFDVFTTVRQLAANRGYEAILGAGKGAYIGWGAFPADADVKTVVSDGEDVPDLAPILVQGKVTVVDFSALWCKPCRIVDQHMADVLKARTDVAYRKLEVGDWDTPLAKRYLKKVPQLPFVIVFGPSGRKVQEIVGADVAKLDAAISQGANR